MEGKITKKRRTRGDRRTGEERIRNDFFDSRSRLPSSPPLSLLAERESLERE